MSIRILRTAAGMLCWIMALALVGCGSASQPTTEAKAASEATDVPDPARGVAEAALGKSAEILAKGDLAQDGRDQVLVVNRLSGGSAEVAAGSNISGIFVTRAAILENNDGKWSEILLCDEHLKNPRGYLGGSPKGRISGWRLEYSQDPKTGLRMNFTPAEHFNAGQGDAGQSSRPDRPTFAVRWNKSAKRYQTFDQSHERYLSEVPSLETPESTLR
jgi:hypothetical protein